VSMMFSTQTARHSRTYYRIRTLVRLLFWSAIAYGALELYSIYYWSK